MKLQRIFLGRAPGITDSFTLDNLSQEINIVVGPNGSGKTSLCRAMAATLWPSQDKSTSLEIETVWDVDGRVLNAERRSGSVSWKMGGTMEGVPSLPDAHVAACYRLGVRDLMQEDNAADRDIAQKIRIQMAGGYDIKTVIDQGFSVKKKLGAIELRKISDLRRDAGNVRSHFSELAGEEDRLNELEERKQEAKAAEREQRLLIPAIELAELRITVVGHDANLSSYSSDLDAFTGDEIERIDRLETELNECSGKINDEQSALEGANDKIKAANLDTQRPLQTDLMSWINRINPLKEQEHNLRTAYQNEATLKDELTFALENLGGDPPSGVTPDLSNKAMEEIAAFVKERDELTGRGSELRTKAELLESEAITENRDNLNRGAGCLRDWLSAPHAPEFKIPTWLLVAAAIGIVTGIVLAIYQGTVWLTLSGAGAGIALIAMFPSITRRGTHDDRKLYATMFEQCGLEKPDRWSRESVTQLLNSIEEKIAKAHIADENRAQLKPINAEIEKLKSDEEKHETSRVRLKEELGVDIASDLTLAILLNRYKAYRDASESLIGVSARVTSIKAMCTTIIKEAHSFLSPYGYGPKEDAAGLESQFLDLKERLSNYENANELHTSASNRLDTEGTRQRNILTQTEKFYSDRGLNDGDRGALTRMLEELPGYKELKQNREHSARRILELEHQLGERVDLLGLSEEQVQQLSDEAGQTASGLADIAGEIGGIESLVTEARKGNALEVAEANLSEARDALMTLCEQAQHQTAGRFLLEDVDHEHEKLSRPPVMKHAAEYFRTFTRNAYELRLPDVDEPEFSAWDTSAAKSFKLSELSDGTRIQLLLAIRIAFALEAESGTQVPLMLDEALSTADPQRFRAVAESLAELARDGRQIFYMTANPADVVAWKMVCDGTDIPEPHVIDLAQVRGRQAAVSDMEMLRVPPTPEVPEPGAMTAEQYGMAIEVPPAGVLKPIESLHLFYLLRDDLNSLYSLIHKMRITTLGQWVSLSESGRADHVLPANVCSRLNARCRCARAIHEARSVGRGRVIDGEVLRESGAVTERFISRLTSLASDLDGDCTRFLAAFKDRSEERIKGFRADAQQRLQNYLEDNGYTDSRSVASADDIRLQVIAQAHAEIDAGIIDLEECGHFVDQLLSAFDKTSN